MLGVQWEPDWQGRFGASHEAGSSYYYNCRLADYCDVAEDQIGASAEDWFRIDWDRHNHELALDIVSTSTPEAEWKAYFDLKVVVVGTSG